MESYSSWLMRIPIGGKTLERLPRVEIEVGEILFEGTGNLIQEQLEHVFNLFRRKYGDDQVSRWYGGHRSNRRVVAGGVGKGLGKRTYAKKGATESSPQTHHANN